MYTVLTGAITRAAAGTFLGRDLEIAESYRFGLARFWSIVLVGLLTGLAILAGFLLLVIPGFFVLTRLTCTLPALVIEDKRGSAALSRSWNLVAGFGWKVFGTIFVAGLMTGLISSLLTAPFGDSTVLRIVGQSIASVVTMPYTALVGILIYLDLRIRKEHYGPDDLERELAGATRSPVPQLDGLRRIGEALVLVAAVAERLVAREPAPAQRLPVADLVGCPSSDTTGIPPRSQYDASGSTPIETSNVRSTVVSTSSFIANASRPDGHWWIIVSNSR